MEIKKEYDNFSRERIWRKIQYLLWRYPDTNLQWMADQISTTRGIVFHKRYFSRLKNGSLGHNAINNIVEWISERYDPSFSKTFQKTPTFVAAGINNVSLYSSFNLEGNFTLIKGNEHQRLASVISRDKSGLFFDVDYDLRALHLSFLGGARMIVAEACHDIPTLSIFFIENAGLLYLFDGTVECFNKVSERCMLTLTPDNYLALAEFYLRYIMHRSPKILGCIDVLAKYLVDTFEGQNIISNSIYDVFEPPALSFGDQITNSTIAFDYIEADALFRANFTMNGNLKACTIETICVTTSISDLVNEDRSRFYLDGSIGQLIVEYPHPKVLDFLSNFPSSNYLLEFIESGVLTLKAIKSPARGFAYVPTQKILFFSYDGEQTYTLEREAIELCFNLYLAAVQLSVIDPPVPKEDLIEYASFVHGRCLDGLTNVMELCDQILAVQKSELAVMTALKDLKLAQFYREHQKGATRGQLYEVYATVYENNL